MSELDVETKALQSTPFFTRLSPDDIEAIIQIGEAVDMEADVAIVEHGELGDAMYIILDGAAEVDVGGRFHRLGQGDFFGEMALIAANRRMATVKAVEHVRVLRIPAEGFQAFLLEHPSVAVSMLKAVVERLREVEQRIDAWMAS